MTNNFKFDKNSFKDYELIAINKKSRYVILRKNNTKKLVIVDILDLRILYEIESKICDFVYVRPKLVFIGVPKVEYLINKKNTAYVFFLNEYNLNKCSSILVFENNVIYIFNSLENSMVKITNIDKFVLLIYSSFLQGENEVASGYEISLRYLNIFKEIQEIKIDILDKSIYEDIGNISINGVISYKTNNYFGNVQRRWTSLLKKRKREISTLDIPSFSDIEGEIIEKSNSIFNIILAKHYTMLK